MKKLLWAPLLLAAFSSFLLGQNTVIGGGGSGGITGGTCSNKAVTALNTSGVPTCTTITSAYVDSSIAPSTSPALVTPKIGGTTITNVPVMTWVSPMLNTTAIGSAALNTIITSFTPPSGITVLRIEAQELTSATSLSACTTSPVVSVTDGTTNTNLTVANGTYSDSGAVSQNYAGGTKLSLKVTTIGVACSGGTGYSFTVQYRMQ